MFRNLEVTATIRSMDRATMNQKKITQQKDPNRPAAFFALERPLVFAFDAINTVSRELEKGPIRMNPIKYNDALAECKRKINLLNYVLQRIIDSKKPASEAYKDVWRTHGRDVAVETIMIAVVRSACILAEDESMKGLVDVIRLRGEIARLFGIEASIPSDSGGRNMNSAPGLATSSEQTGSSKQ
ncbi:hypothetical protein G7046_g4891 [Stylonectria norvegica]|nr:hypothetical protein G7046_g4891 [Stylonectria norvegica]